MVHACINVFLLSFPPSASHRNATADACFFFFLAYLVRVGSGKTCANGIYGWISGQEEKWQADKTFEKRKTRSNDKTRKKGLHTRLTIQSKGKRLNASEIWWVMYVIFFKKKRLNKWELIFVMWNSLFWRFWSSELNYNNFHFLKNSVKRIQIP